MTTWKKAVVFGSLGAGAVLFFSGKRTPAIVSATVGLAVLASEYPETFEELWERAPDYVTRGVHIWNTLSQIAEKFAEQATERAEQGWRQINVDAPFPR